MSDEFFVSAGYLSAEACEGEKGVVSRFPQALDWLRAGNRTAMELLRAIDDPAVIKDDRDRVIVGILLVIAIRRFQASVLLFQRFMLPEGESVCRTGLEAVFLLGAYLKDGEAIFELLESDREASSRAGINGLLRNEGRLALSKEQVLGLEAALSSLPSEKSRIKWDQVADAADMRALYDVAYRAASMNSAHVTERMMSRHFEGDAAEGNVIFDSRDETLVPAAHAALQMLHAAVLTIAQHYDMKAFADRVLELGASTQMPMDGHSPETA